jgi:hypothetical protein
MIALMRTLEGPLIVRLVGFQYHGGLLIGNLRVGGNNRQIVEMQPESAMTASSRAVGPRSSTLGSRQVEHNAMMRPLSTMD